MPFDKQLYDALKKGMAGLTDSDRQTLRLLWRYPGIPVRFLPNKIGQEAGGSVQLTIGHRIGKRKLWGLLPRRIKQELEPPGYLPFYSGTLIRTRAVVDRKGRRFVCFDLRDEAVRALRELRVIGAKREKPSASYRPIETLTDDNISIPQDAPADRKRQLRSIAVRRGQARFRRELLRAYECRCPVTGCTESKVLEAAHIDPFAKRGRYKATNGLLLRADWHTLFDLYMWTIDPKRAIVKLSAHIADRDYLRFADRPIKLPVDPTFAPDSAALRRRYRRFRALAHRT